MWYSQQADEGKAPGYPLGFGQYGGIEPVRVVESKKEDGSSSDVGPLGG